MADFTGSSDGQEIATDTIWAAEGDIAYATGNDAAAVSAKSTASTRVLTNTGDSNIPAWGQVALATGVSGSLPVANGGTAATSAGIAAFNSITGYSAAGATGTTSTNLVFSTSPTLVTPALGTPTSGVLTNTTGLPVGGLANGTDGQLITWGTDAVATTVAVGTATHVLTSNGVDNPPTFQAAAAGGTSLSVVIALS